MERGEWENEPEYPRAPLPAHERTWRHPSEQGASEWVQSEPPLVVGRGLSVATGTVGAVLAVGLLWLMIPHNNRGSGVADVSSTVRASSSELSLRQPTSVLAIASSTIVSVAISGIAGVPTTTKVRAATTSSQLFSALTIAPSNPASDPSTDDSSTDASGPDTTDTDATGTSSSVASASSTTVALPTGTVSGQNPSGQATALAVALAPGHFVAATAASVGGRAHVTLQLSTGVTVVGTVVDIDMVSGIAVLSIPLDTETSPIQASVASIPTDGATVLSPERTPVSVWRDATGTQISYDPTVQVAEGSLVLDTDNHLIGMCTMTDGGIHVLDAQALLSAINAAIAKDKPWLGLRAAADDSGALAVLESYADGPAAAAGIQAGDLIRAFDGTPVASINEIRAALLAHHPGDTVTLSILAHGATAPVDIVVTLTPDPGAL